MVGHDKFLVIRGLHAGIETLLGTGSQTVDLPFANRPGTDRCGDACRAIAGGPLCCLRIRRLNVDNSRKANESEQVRSSHARVASACAEALRPRKGAGQSRCFGTPSSPPIAGDREVLHEQLRRFASAVSPPIANPYEV